MTCVGHGRFRSTNKIVVVDQAGIRLTPPYATKPGMASKFERVLSYGRSQSGSCELSNHATEPGLGVDVVSESGCNSNATAENPSTLFSATSERSSIGVGALIAGAT